MALLDVTVGAYSTGMRPDSETPVGLLIMLIFGQEWPDGVFGRHKYPVQRSHGRAHARPKHISVARY